MKSRAFRTFDVDGKMYSFSPEGLKGAITQYQMQRKDEGKTYLLKDISEEIALELNISVEAFSNWRKGYNGPSDIDRIKEISTVLGCDYKDLLKTQGGEVHMISKEVTYNPAASEKESIQSIINDLLEIIECFGKSNAFDNVKVITDADGENSSNIVWTEFDEWFYNIRIKMRKSAYHISKDSMDKLERLFLETKAFVDHPVTRIIIRWREICKGFHLQRCLDDINDDMLTCDDLLHPGNFSEEDDYIDEDMREYLNEELSDYIQGDFSLDNPIEVIGYRIGAWYMEIVRHDFPEIFVD